MSQNIYLPVIGFVQKFGDKPAVTEREVSGQTVRDITVKAVGGGKLVRITVWPEFAHVPLGAGYLVAAEGKYSASEGKNGQTYYNVSASSLVVITPATKTEREVVNNAGGSADASSNDVPF